MRKPVSIGRRAAGLGFVLLVTALGAHAAAAPAPRDSGARSLIITYHTVPANRVALRHDLETTGMAQFESWKKQGVLAEATLLAGRYVDSGGWDDAAILTFATDADAARWREIEQVTPAGLSEKTLALTTAIETTPVDLIREKAGPVKSKNPVYLAIPYEYQVSLDQYIQYLDGYTVPQLEGWMAEGVLSRYAIYVSRYPAGRAWSALLILEYQDDAALASREAVVAKVRERLKSDPAWKAISDDKKSIRVEKQLVIADPIIARHAP